jgi:hypothetical protein
VLADERDGSRAEGTYATSRRQDATSVARQSNRKRGRGKDIDIDVDIGTEVEGTLGAYDFSAALGVTGSSNDRTIGVRGVASTSSTITVGRE